MLKMISLAIIGVALLVALGAYIDRPNNTVIESHSNFIHPLGTEGEFRAFNATWLDINDNPHSLDEFKGKPTILHFWASWCPPCRGEFRGLDQWNKTQGKELGISLVALSGDDSMMKAESFIRNGGYDIPVRQTNSETEDRWFIRAIPTTYFIDADGYIRGVIQGATDWSNPDYRKEVAALFATRLEKGI